MIAYNFDPTTHEYTGRETAPENPKRPGEYLLPTHSTLTEPPEIREGYARVWTGTVWTYTEDHRGETVWQDHDTSREIRELGPIPEGWTAERPDKAMTREWITEAVYQAKAAKAYGGITVNRSGVDYTFATDPSSIALCNAVMLSATDNIDWKVWHDGEPYTLRLDATTFRAIFAAGMAMVQQAFSTEAELNTEYAALTDAEIAALTEAEVTAHIAEAFARINPAVEV